MRIGRVIRHRLRSLFRGSSADADMQRELDLHLEQLTKEYVGAGLSESEARHAATRAFGPVESIKEVCRDMRRVHFVEDLLKDVGYALRVLRRSPGFTTTAVVSLALGIGANTAIFSLVNAFLIRPLPYPQSGRLVAVFERSVMADGDRMSVAPGNYFDWREQSTSFEHLSAYTLSGASVTRIGSDEAGERVMVCSCSGNLLSTLGVSPVLGRTFRDDEDRFGAVRTAIISYDLWQRQFGGMADVVGRGIRLNAQDYQVVGVMPRGFMFANRDVQVWRPLLLAIPPAQQIRHDVHYLQVVGRVRAGVPLSQATAEIDGISARYKSAHPTEATGKGATTVPLHEQLVQGVRTSLLVLLAAVACVLTIACVNIANLVLTRAITRTREIGVRAALGASRGRIVRQLVTESVVLALAGGVAGALMAWWLTNVLAANAPGAEAILPSGGVRVDPVVFLFALGTALLSGVVVGLLPALRATRGEVAAELKDSSRSATGGRSHGRLRSVLVTAEMALSLVLLVAAGLLLRSFVALHEVQPGVRVDRTLMLSTTMAGASYQAAGQRSAFLATLGERLRLLPGVQSAGLTTCMPLTGSCNTLFYYVEGRPYTPGKFLAALERSVNPEYFQAAGIPLIRGRSFSSRDGVGFDPAHPRLGSLIISESMARQVFSDEDALGKRVFFDFEVQRERNEGLPAPRYEVIGIVGDVLPTLDGGVTPTMYRPVLDVPPGTINAVLHTAADPSSVAGSARALIRELDRTLTVFGIQTLSEAVDRLNGGRRFTLLLFASFAALAVLLAAVGLYGVVSYSVSQRRGEIGIRMALGATKGEVSRMVMMQGLKPALAGSILGLIAAGFASAVLERLLFGITPLDTLTFALVPALLLSIAAAACYVPALRAAGQNPTAALRLE